MEQLLPGQWLGEGRLHPFHEHAGDFTFTKEKLCFYGSLGTEDEQVKFQMSPLSLPAELKPFTREIFAQASKKA